jgi:O-antigen/teichoic acid export membrane protein
VGKKIFSIYFSSSLVSSGIGFLTAIYLTNVLTPEEYGYLGIFSVALYVVEPLISLSSLGLIQINYVSLSSEKYKYFRDGYLTASLLCFVFSLVVSVALVGFFFEFVLLIFAVPILALARNLTNVIVAEFIQDQKAKLVGVSVVATSVFSLAITIVFVQFIGLSWGGRLLALILAEILIFYFVCKFSKPMEFRLFSKKEWLEVVRFGIPVFIGVGAAWLMHESDKVIVLDALTLEDVGIYSFAYTIGKSIDVVSVSYVKTIRPMFYKKMELGEFKRIDLIKALSVLGIILVFVCGIGSFLTLKFGILVLRESYWPGLNVIAWVLFAFSMFGLYRVCSLVLEFHKKNYQKTFILYFSAGSNVVLSYYLVRLVGIDGPAEGTFLGFFILFILSFLYINNFLNNPKIKY